MSAHSFWQRPRFWAGLVLSSLFAIFLAAGTWQLQRAHYKERLQADVLKAAEAPAIHAGPDVLDAEVVNLHHLEAQGHWLAERTILLDNKVHGGVVGYEVITPLRLENSDRYLLVNRGWIKAPLLRSELPKIVTPEGRVVVEGIARVPSNRFIELGAENIVGTVWQNLTMERYQRWSHLPLQPVLLYQENASLDGLVHVQAAPEASGINAERHYGYAFTWFSLAAVTIVLGLFNWCRSKTQTVSNS
jgi:surfeit locus 1 family protein